MCFNTPDEIQKVAWQGELVPSENTRFFGIGQQRRPVVTVGQPEIWPVAEALEIKTGEKWTPPLGAAMFWLIRLACTLREPAGLSGIVQAQQTLSLHALDENAPARAAYAFSLFPDRLGAESEVEISATLGPELKFGKDKEFKLGELGRKFTYKKVFPVIQSYGAGEEEPYWVFKPHPNRPLDGTQFVYAVVATKAGVDKVRAAVEIVVETDTDFGIIRLGLPSEAKAQTSFDIL